MAEKEKNEEEEILDFFTFPALSKIKKPILDELLKRFNSFGIDNKPKTVWVRFTSNARPVTDNPRKGKERDNIFVLLGGGTLNSERKLRFGFDDTYKYQRLNDKNQLFRPTPGIESISITNKGEVGSLRKATVRWWAPSIQDLDELSPYFLTVGFTVLLEWGWGELETHINAIDTGQDENQLRRKMTNFYKNPTQLFKKQQESGGKYDALIGRISNFSWRVNEDGSFSCTTEVTSMGELMAGISLVEQLNYKNPDNKNKKKTIKEYIIKDFDKNIEKSRNELPSKETRKFGVTKADVFIDDGHFWGLLGKEMWVTWGFIEDIIVNKYLGIVSDSGYRPFEIDSRGVLISNDSFLATSDPGVMMISKEQHSVSGRIKSFDTEDRHSGMLRNIYVNVKKIRDVFEKADTLREALKQLLNMIEVAGSNIWDFKLYVDPIREKLRVIDLNYVSELAEKIDPKNPNDVFSFGGFGGKSIIKDLSLETNLSNQVSISFLYAINKEKTDDSVVNEKNDTGLKTLYGDYRDLVMEKLRIESPKSDGAGQDNLPKGKSDVDEQNRAKAKLSLSELKQFIIEKTKIEIEGTKFVSLDSKAAQYLSQYLRRTTFENRRRHMNLIPLNIDVTVDGISGIIPGNIFQLENIPSIYSGNGVFQVIGVDHSITPDNWDTTIHAFYRIVDIEKELLTKVLKKVSFLLPKVSPG